MNATETTVACHVRAPMLLEPIDSQIETLRACESESVVDSLVLRSWPDRVALSDDSQFREAVDVFRRFERWADRRGVSVRPPFEMRTSSSTITDTEKEVLVTPLIAVAVYRDDRLVGVYPHSEGEETYTAADAIATLRTGDVPTPLGASPRPDATATDDCPDCGSGLVDGQGLFGCVDCEWVGTARGDGRLVAHTPDPQAGGRSVAPARR